MPHFDIVKKSDIDKTFRVARICGDFDLKGNEHNEHFVGDITLPEKWNIGLIVGSSGTGKTSIARELFGDKIIRKFEYHAKSVVDDMPKNASIDDIERAFYSVGFGSVPSWLKPYAVLSNGEQMRVDIARALLEFDEFVFDEFTSVVDRTVAKVASLAIAKSIRRNNKRFIAVSCHRDIEEWLEPDWVFDTNEMKCFFAGAHVLKCASQLEGVGLKNGPNFEDIII